MTNFVLGNKSKTKLIGVHSDLVLVVERAIALVEVDFTVLEGIRTLERQRQLVAEGSSTTMRSRHLTGHAVDLGAWINNGISWDWKYYELIAAAMKSAANELDVLIEWGGDWKSFKDGPHFQLPWSIYK